MDLETPLMLIPLLTSLERRNPRKVRGAAGQVRGLPGRTVQKYHSVESQLQCPVTIGKYTSRAISFAIVSSVDICGFSIVDMDSISPQVQALADAG
jgi:hypothetical protein